MRRTSITPEPTQVYARTARLLHWLTVALLALQVPVGLYMTHRGNTLNIWDALTGALYSGHKLGGIIILLVVVLRLLYRVTQGVPPDEPTIEPWQRVVSHLNHWALYVLLIATPLAGYVGISMFPALDIFGRTEERRAERALIVEYRADVEDLLTGLNAVNHALAVDLARIPEQIKGYGHVKDRNRAAARRRREDLLLQWRGSGQAVARAA